MNERLSKIHDDLSGMKEAMSGLMERQDRECNHDEEICLFQYLPAGDPNRDDIFADIAEPLRSQKWGSAL